MLDSIPLQILRGNRRGYGFSSSTQREFSDDIYSFCASVLDSETGRCVVDMFQAAGGRVFHAALRYLDRERAQPRIIVSASGENSGRLEKLVALIQDGIITSDKIKEALALH